MIQIWRFFIRKQILFSLSLLVLISCGKNTTESEEDEGKTGTIKDVEGNRYQVIKIGSQWWMAENLQTTKYANGEWIINVTGSKTWPNLSTGAYCNYGNDFNNKAIYGNLYNWHAVTDSRHLAPVGWHIPTDKEWQILIEFLGGHNLAGGRLKDTGTIEAGDGLWYAPNAGATNESFFSALPGGFRLGLGTFDGLGSTPHFWSSTEKSDSTAWQLYLNTSNSDANLDANAWKQAGYSIRCIRD
jgi:uncharacterized protein (TIGR02145 family)